MRLSGPLFLVAVVALSLSCGARKARLYNLDSGQVLNASFTWGGSGKGKLTIVMPDGEQCTGEYVTVPEGSSTWGSVFGTVYGPGGSVSGSATGYSVSVEGKQKGTAIATSNKGTVIECEYVTSSWSPQGYGACQDNKGTVYRLMF